MRVTEAVQKHHPDNHSGWTVTVLDSRGLLYARFYGDTREQAERRARDFIEDAAQAVSSR